MLNEIDRSQLYKGKYIICFYDKTGERLLYMFDNIKEILCFQRKEINDTNTNLIAVELYRALKTDTHFVKFLTGEVMQVYAINVEEFEEEETNEICKNSEFD